MKNLIALSAFAALALQTAPAFGLVRVIANCTTNDGKYSVLVSDNQGIGPVRTSHFSAVIKDDRDEVVGSYGPLNETNFHSISFGHKSYVSQDGAPEFYFGLPSTNTLVTLNAKLTDGTQLNYGGFRNTPVDQQLTCR